MNKYTADLIVKEVFMDMKADLKSNKQIGMEFHVFFDDGYWRFDPKGLSKDQAYGVLNVFLNEVKTLGYSVTSDCNIRSPETGEIIGEQLMAALVSPEGKIDVNMQPYTRLPNGKIRYEKPLTADGLTFGGEATMLYRPIMPIPDDVKNTLVVALKAEVARCKIPYKTYGKENGGPTAH